MQVSPERQPVGQGVLWYIWLHLIKLVWNVFSNSVPLLSVLSKKRTTGVVNLWVQTSAHELPTSHVAALFHCRTSRASCEWLPLSQIAFYQAVNASAFISLVSPSFFPDGHTHSLWTDAYFSPRLTHGSYTHIVLCCQCMIDSLADLCLHTRCQKLCCVITQSMLEILFTFTPKGSSALGPLADDIASAFVYLRKSIGGRSEVRGL